MLIAFAFRGQQLLLITLLCVSIVNNNAVYMILQRHWKHPLYVHNYYPRSCPTFSQSQRSLTVSRHCCRPYYYRVPIGKWTPLFY